MVIPPAPTTTVASESDNYPAGQLPGGERIAQLDGLRAIAFLSVFAHHAFQIPVLWAGVDLFFVLSGFLITGILIRTRDREGYFRAFYTRRFLRIFPPYYLFLAITFTFFYADWRSIWYWYVLFLSDLKDSIGGGSPSMLQPMWSLAIEEQFYLVWPFVVFFVRGRRLERLAWGLILTAPLARVVTGVHAGSHWPVYFLPTSRVDLLAAGALLAVLRERESSAYLTFARSGPWIIITCVLTFCGVAYLLPSFRTSANTLLFNSFGYSLICLAMASLVALAADGPRSWFSRLLTIRPLVKLGAVSYTLYLWHELLLDLASNWSSQIVLRTTIAFALLVGIAAASWKLYEGPIQLLKERVARYGPRRQY